MHADEKGHKEAGEKSQFFMSKSFIKSADDVHVSEKNQVDLN